MRDFREKSFFPYYCEKDGLVSVNFRIKPYQCPVCSSTAIQQYGLEPISIIPPVERRGVAIQAWEYEAYPFGNLCPQCKKMTMTFEGAHLLTD
jgi:hypothetical protein